MLTLGPGTSDTPPQLKNSVRLQLRCEYKPDVLCCQVGAWAGKSEDLLPSCSRKVLVLVFLKVLTSKAFAAVYRLGGRCDFCRFSPAQWLFISAVFQKVIKCMCCCRGHLFLRQVQTPRRITKVRSLMHCCSFLPDRSLKHIHVMAGSFVCRPGQKLGEEVCSLLVARYVFQRYIAVLASLT